MRNLQLHLKWLNFNEQLLQCQKKIGLPFVVTLHGAANGSVSNAAGVNGRNNNRKWQMKCMQYVSRVPCVLFDAVCRFADKGIRFEMRLEFCFSFV